MKDFLIIGQGVAGSFLAWELIKHGKKVLVVDDAHKKSSSIISAGIINPITGKRFALTPDFEKYYAFASKSYSELTQIFGESFFVSKPILRLFNDEDELNKCQRKHDSNSFRQYFDSINPANTYKPEIDDSLGSIEISRAGYCRTKKLLESFKQFFLAKNSLSLQKVFYDAIKVTDNGIHFNGQEFKFIIFCEGYQSQYNPWFDFLKFNSVKGELLKIRMDSASLPEAIINKGKWCVPLGGDEWACGATYIWEDLNCKASMEGRQEILEGLHKCLDRDIKVLSHQAAVRPVMLDQRPVLGIHPDIPSMGIFNGLGSKGFLMAPYYAYQFAQYSSNKGDIAPEIQPKRFLRKV